MFLLSGGPRSGQFVDGLPTDYVIPSTPLQVPLGEWTATVAIWASAEPAPGTADAKPWPESHR